MTGDPALFTAALHSWLDPAAELLAVEEHPMPGVGYSGASLRRYGLRYRGAAGEARAVELVVKEALPVERRVMVRLYRQGAPGIPFCYAQDLESSERAPLCLEYLAPASGQPGADALARAAEALAAIHAANLRDPALPGWLPAADGAFAQTGYLLGNAHASWARALTDAEFARDYGHLSGPLQAAGERFTRFLEDSWQAGRAVTLIHGDLHDGNLVVRAGQPYFLDWEHARCGALYLDLPNLLDGDGLRAYYQAITHLGAGLDESEFWQGVREAGRYVGFKYLGFMLAQWPRRSEPALRVREKLENLIGLAIEGQALS